MERCCEKQKLDRITGNKYKCFSCGATFAGNTDITNTLPYIAEPMLW